MKGGEEVPVCGETMPLSVGEAFLGACSLPPKHRGKHRGSLEVSWAKENPPLEEGLILFSIKPLLIERPQKKGVK